MFRGCKAARAVMCMQTLRYHSCMGRTGRVLDQLAGLLEGLCCCSTSLMS